MSKIPASLASLFASANGSETVYRHRLTRMDYTEGVREMAERAKAFWLIDDILINARHGRLLERCQGFAAWTLWVAGGKGVLRCSDGGIGGAPARTVFEQAIEWTDFPEGTVTLYLEGGVLMLPGER